MPPEPFPVLVHPFPGPTPRSCAYEAGSPASRNALVFIGGLGDGPHTVPYVRALAGRLQSEPELSYSLFEVRLASAFGGFGHRRLADDVADLAALVRHLRGALGRRRVVLLGHSTGCQDCMEYTDYARHGAEPVDGFILQGPVSDREAFGPLVPKEELEAGVAKAADLVRSGRGDTIMPKDKLAEMFDAPITAYRYHSLLAPGGDDDFFSSDLPDDKIASFWSKFQKPVLVLPSGEDEHVPESIDVPKLIARWASLAPDGIVSDLSGPIPGASHTVRSPESREWMADIVVRFLSSLE
ncbi:hypothetical protein RB595_000670 [Gaeumannomyces hyphopodioides]